MNRTRPIAIGITLILIATFTALPQATAQSPQTTLALTISMASVTPQAPLEAFDGNPPLVYDFNGDGIMEIIVHNDNKRVYVFDSQSGQLDAEILTKYPPGWGARPLNGVEAAVLQFGGVPHLVVANSAAYITVLRYEDGASSRGNFVFTKLWETRTNACDPDASMDAKPVLADLNNDGTFEILVQTEEVGVFALRMDGSTMWKQCIGGGNGEPAVADIDFDGQLDVVWASDGGVITAMNGNWGTTKWTFWANHPSFNLHSASVPVGPTIGQVDGVGPLDIVFGARDSHDADDWSNDHAALFVVKGDGQLLWMRQDPNGAPLTYTRPIIADVDSDGKADIIWADWNTVGHKPPFPGDPNTPPWQVTGPAHFYRYDSTGVMRWRTTLDTYWQNKDLALADVDNDGVQEVLANGPGPGGDGIWYLNSITGAKETFISVHPWKVSRGPIVEDLWNTGTMQWVVPVSAAASPASGGAILVFDTHAPYNAMWPHLPYPVVGQGTTPPPPGTFNPTFTVPASVNNWWVEVAVNSPSVVSSVTASVNGGAPVALAKQSWGNWAKSFHVATGASVVFTATNNQGQTAQSQAFSWLGAGPPPPPPPSETFEAGFTVPSSVNNWWVEVRVDGNHPVTAVSASVNGGTAVSLAKQSWGNWAKSFHVPSGATVKFTATDNTGQTVQSKGFQWLGAPPPPPPSGDFKPTFTVPSGVNNWWVETKVTTSHTVTGVTASVGGGPQIALAKQSWGAWAKSFHVATGASVVFTATNAQGQTAQSQAFSWLSDGSAFKATFKVTDPSNNWWVETYVTSNQPVSKVEAQVNGGAWTALPKTSWGSYAKSFFVPDNAAVKFRATSTGGFVVTSGTTTWI